MSSYVIVHKSKEGKLEKTSVMNEKDAKHYCMSLEVLHGLGTHIVVQADKLQEVDLSKLPAVN
jgi:hypothetical protein